MLHPWALKRYRQLQISQNTISKYLPWINFQWHPTKTEELRRMSISCSYRGLNNLQGKIVQININPSLQPSQCSQWLWCFKTFSQKSRTIPRKPRLILTSFCNKRLIPKMVSTRTATKEMKSQTPHHPFPPVLTWDFLLSHRLLLLAAPREQSSWIHTLIPPGQSIVSCFRSRTDLRLAKIWTRV